MSATGLQEYQMKIDPLIQLFMKNAEDNLGVEAVEENYEDAEFIMSILSEQMNMAATAMIFASEKGVPATYTYTACMISAIKHYREWLLDRGVDVRELEGRQ